MKKKKIAIIVAVATGLVLLIMFIAFKNRPLPDGPCLRDDTPGSTDTKLYCPNGKVIE